MGFHQNEESSTFARDERKIPASNPALQSNHGSLCDSTVADKMVEETRLLDRQHNKSNEKGREAEIIDEKRKQITTKITKVYNAITYVVVLSEVWHEQNAIAPWVLQSNLGCHC